MSTQNFNRNTRILQGPIAFLTFKDWIIISISSGVAGDKNKEFEILFFR